jgi:transposase-like protein
MSGVPYSAEERERILAVARREGLTALEVRRRFGVYPKTFYKWRGPVGSGRRPKRPGTGSEIGSHSSVGAAPATEIRRVPNKKGQVWRYTTAQRDHILETARKEKLSGAEVAKRFGISQWTYYGWRSPGRGIHVKTRQEWKSAVFNGNYTAKRRSAEFARIRATVRAELERLLAPIVRGEVDACLREELCLPKRRGSPGVRQ